MRTRAGSLPRYLRHIDLAFAFELMFARWDPDEIARILGEDWRGLAWTLSNHDFSRVASRLGEENVRLAATLTLTLPGTAFVSLLNLYRELIRLRRDMPLEFELLGVEDGLLSYRRGNYVIALNFSAEERLNPLGGEVVFSTHPVPPQALLPHGATVIRQR